MASQKIVLSIREALKSYANVPALRGVSFDLYAGELLGFLGPNGAGKTTLIRCISGRSRLDGGTIGFRTENGRNALGVVPQSMAIYEDLTAAQNLWSFGRLQRIPRYELRRRVEDALGWSNLLDRRNDLAKTFSGGMQRRLNLACSVLHRPQVLLLDEPTVGVDPQSRERIYVMLDILRDQGTAILLTTHQLDEAQFRCDRIAVVDRGVVVQVGTMDELIANTVGSQQQLSVTFRRVPDHDFPQLSFDASKLTGRCAISDVTVQLPQILHEIQEAGEPVTNVVLQGPTLQSVFLQLTGTDLRE